MLTQKVDILGTCVQPSFLSEIAICVAAAAVITVAFAHLSRLMPCEKSFHHPESKQ